MAAIAKDHKTDPFDDRRAGVVPPVLDGVDDEKSRSADEDMSLEDGRSIPALTQDKSRGVWEMEAMVKRITPTRRAVIYGFFCLLAYVLSLSAWHSLPDRYWESRWLTFQINPPLPRFSTGPCPRRSRNTRSRRL